jgi:hypothetical protein
MGTSHIKEYQVGVHLEKIIDYTYLQQTYPKGDL